MKKHICVFCSSIPEIDPIYLKSAAELGELIAKRGDIVVYGGAKNGSMGMLATSALEAGGEVIGIISKNLADQEIANTDITELVITETLSERKAHMQERSDAFIVLPGGFGTLEEGLQMMQAAQLTIHTKPTVFVNTRGFYNPLLQMFDRLFERRFARGSQRASYIVVDELDQALAAIDGWDPSVLLPKWGANSID